MNMLFAMAGIAEAGAAAEIIIGYFALFLIAVIALAGLLSTSRIVASIAYALMGIITYLSTPWHAFMPFESEDYDAVQLMVAFKQFAIWWCVTVLFVILSCLIVFTRRKRTVIRVRIPLKKGFSKQKLAE